jgi:membrane-associated protease RseP (regulator of RpoE activity)
MTVSPDSQDGSGSGGAPPPLPVLHREVLRPTSDRGRLAALATICSLAGVALGFALAGTMFASIPIANARAHVVHSTCTRAIYATPAWIGVGVRGDGPTTGAWVRVVRSSSPAAAHGLIPGDVITRIDGAAISDASDLVFQVRSRRPGTQVELGIRHGDSVRSEQLTLEPMPLDVWRTESAK